MGVPIPEEELEKILRQFDRLSNLLVDTSSLIQIEKAGFLSLLSGKVQLFTLPQVREEYLRGDPSLPFPLDVRILSSPTPTRMAPQGTADCAPPTNSAASADEANQVALDPAPAIAPTDKATRKAFGDVPGTDPTDKATRESFRDAPGTASTNEASREPYRDTPAPPSADEALLAVARTRRFALLSEDRKLLLKADGLGLEYYNALMMLEFLEYRRTAESTKKPLTADQALESAMQKHSSDPGPSPSGLFSLAENPPFDYPSLKRRLLAQSRYSLEVRRFAEQLHTFIEKVRG